jgi:hypothetical protein
MVLSRNTLLTSDVMQHTAENHRHMAKLVMGRHHVMQVLKFVGPEHGRDAGHLESVFIDTKQFGLSHPYDIRWSDQGLVVTTHAAEVDRKRDAKAAISLFRRDGSLVRSVTCDKLRHPNTIVTC